MSTLTGARDDLAGALALAARFTASHKSNPQLNQLRLRVLETGESFVEATDQRTSLRTALYAQSPDELDLLVHPDLSNAVKAMAQGDVTIAQDGTVVTVSGKGKAKYTVATLDQTPIDAFPGEDEVEWSDVVPIDASDALKTMDVAARYASRKEENPSIVGVNLRVADGQLAVEATDGSRLFHDRVALPAPGFPFQEDEVMLPPRMVAELNRVFPDGEVAFAASTNLFFARDPQGETLFASRRIGGKFPDVARIVPEYDGAIATPRAELLAALERMRSVVRGKPVQLRFEGKELRLSTRTGSGSAEEWVDLGSPVPTRQEVAFNVDYLTEALGLFEADEVQLRVASSLRPVQLRGDGERFVLLAPVKY